MRRVAEALAISIWASRQRSAGGVSAENAAQHFVPPGATWQRSPSFLMQKPQDFLQASDWLYQRQRVSRQMLPPIVPMLRRTGEATVFAASTRTGYWSRKAFECSISRSVLSAAISIPCSV